MQIFMHRRELDSRVIIIIIVDYLLSKAEHNSTGNIWLRLSIA